MTNKEMGEELIRMARKLFDRDVQGAWQDGDYNMVVLETISDPDAIAEGWGGSLIAMRHYAKTPISEKEAVVVYREMSPQDGFVITAFMTSKIEKLLKERIVIWRR
ncbi:MAG: hypothetical protein U9R11_03090 [Chloroflexota bacterium]|nr:hypothetical protein [Chloroflexota bacterium]